MKSILRIVFLCIFSLHFLPKLNAAPAGDCSGTPGDAVLELPAPFNTWGQIICNGTNHSISGKGDWFWKGESNYSQMQIVSTGQYFKEINVHTLKGDSITPYVSILEGKQSKSKPKTYVLELIAENDTQSKIIIFDYGMNSLWGMKCNSECDASSRFMIINRAEQ